MTGCNSRVRFNGAEKHVESIDIYWMRWKNWTLKESGATPERSLTALAWLSEGPPTQRHKKGFSPVDPSSEVNNKYLYLCSAASSGVFFLDHCYTAVLSSFNVIPPRRLDAKTQFLLRTPHMQPILQGPDIFFYTCFKRAIRSIKWR